MKGRFDIGLQLDNWDGSRSGFLIKGLITANLSDLGTQPVVSEELIIFKSGSITSGQICLNKHVGTGSSMEVDELAEEINVASI